jgi:peptide/nickel transport system permease protein
LRSYLTRRVLGSVFVLYAVTSLVFVLNRLAPGSPAEVILGSSATPRSIAQLNRQLGLNLPLWHQYFLYLGNALHGNFGLSYYSHTSALAAVLGRVPVTAELAILTILVSIVVSVAMAALTTRFRARALDGAADAVFLAFLSVPTFWSGLLLLLLFGVYWQGVLPASGWVFLSANPVGNLETCILPVAALSLPTIAILYRSLKPAMADVSRRDYVSYAKAVGFTDRRVIGGIVLPNAAVPVTTVAGVLLGYLIGGSLIIETILSIPGLGQEVVNSFQRRDYPIASASICVVALFFVVINLSVDLVYAALNPKVRQLYASKAGQAHA